LSELIEFSGNVLEKAGIDAPTRTAALKTHIETLLEKYGIKEDVRLLDSSKGPKGCKL
jgi:hypothetical protein